jgi:hypothetical protein
MMPLSEETNGSAIRILKGFIRCAMVERPFERLQIK